MSSDRSTFLRTLMQVTGEKKIHECFPLGDVWGLDADMREDNCRTEAGDSGEHMRENESCRFNSKLSLSTLSCPCLRVPAREACACYSDLCNEAANSNGRGWLLLTAVASLAALGFSA